MSDSDESEDNDVILDVIRGAFPTEYIGITREELVGADWHPFFTRMAYMGFVLLFSSEMALLLVMTLLENRLGPGSLWHLTNPVVLGSFVLVIIAFTTFVEKVNTAGKFEVHQFIPGKYKSEITALSKSIIGLAALGVVIVFLHSALGFGFDIFQMVQFLLVTVFIVGILLVGIGFLFAGVVELKQNLRDE